MPVDGFTEGEKLSRKWTILSFLELFLIKYDFKIFFKCINFYAICNKVRSFYQKAFLV